MRCLPHRRESYIPKGARKITAKKAEAVAYVATLANGRLHAVGFAGKAQKPSFNYLFRTPERCERHITQWFANVAAHAERMAEARMKRTAFAHTCQVGDIYRTSWGYDQTNVEFFEIVEIRGKFAILREVAAASVDDGQGSERCVPQSGAFLEPRYNGDDRGQPIRRLIQDGRIKIDNVRTAWPWGQRVAGVVIGEAAHRTALGWGH